MPTNGAKGSARSRWLRYAAMGYGAVVVVITVGLIYVIATDTVRITPDKGRADGVAEQRDPDTRAILEDMRGAVPIDGNDPDAAEIEAPAPPSELEDAAPQADQPPPWRRFQAFWDGGDRPRVAVVIDDLGLSTRAARRLARMPGPYTLAFLPYADGLPDQTEKLAAAGHELMVHLPMQPKSAAVNPGPHVLRMGQSGADFDRDLRWNLSRFEGFAGVNNHMGSLLTENRGRMDRLMAALKRRGVYFLDSRTTPESRALDSADSLHVPAATRDVFLDNRKDAAYIRGQLAKAEAIAAEHGQAIAIGHPYPVTLKVLNAWRDGLSDRGFVLVPLSQVIHHRMETRRSDLVNGSNGANGARRVPGR
ncbi:divergent polysaccharide deacetylase family protein [Yunchengibacter salinarum]|uniref:divergent polysaccharide deacetylase family protein n=1 Tax=Yunchengibacter salinarum TaxID=3133399 RepID=UPI0035B672DC